MVSDAIYIFPEYLTEMGRVNVYRGAWRLALCGRTYASHVLKIARIRGQIRPARSSGKAAMSLNPPQQLFGKTPYA
jgi:hypothetical protein